MKRSFAVLIALVGLSAFLTGCLVINVEKSEGTEKKPAPAQTGDSSTEQPAK